MSQVLGIVDRVIAGHLIKKARCTRKMARTGAVTLTPRSGRTLNLNLLCAAAHKRFHVEGCNM